jgi:cytochrome P450
VSLKRKTLKDYNLSDGTFIPKGTHVSVASQAIHLDPDLYENAETFDGFRFSRMREAGKGGQALQHQMITTAPEFLTFGHGRHAWFVSCFDSFSVLVWAHFAD